VATTVEHARLEKAEKELAVSRDAHAETARKCDVLETIATRIACGSKRLWVIGNIGIHSNRITLSSENCYGFSRNDGSAYGDDGEMQLRGLDYRRMPVSELDAAIQHEG
jgi:hypothetical protein